MEKEAHEFSVTYFPHVFLDESDLKRLALYFPEIRLLQVIPETDPGLPEQIRDAQIVQTFCPLDGSRLLEIVARALRSYRELSSLHQQGTLMESLRALALHEDPERSRTELVAHLRRASSTLPPEEVELVESAVFLLLSGNLDQEYRELDRGLDRFLALERNFHQFLSDGTEEETGTIRTEPSLRPGSDALRRQQAFQRLKAWTRICLLNDGEAAELPITTDADLTREISEQFSSQAAGFSGQLPVAPIPSRPLCRLPDPRALSLEEVLALRKSLADLGRLQEWWQALAGALSDLQAGIPDEQQWLNRSGQLQTAVDPFESHWPGGRSAGSSLELAAALYPRLQPHLAFALATRVRSAKSDILAPEGVTGISLLLCP